MRQLSPDLGFPAGMFCASVARVLMFILGLLGVLSRLSVPAGSPAQTNAGAAQFAAPAQHRVTARIQPGENLSALLLRYGLSHPSAQDLIHKLRPVIQGPTLPVGAKIDLVIDSHADKIRALEMVVRKRLVRADATANGWLVDRSAVAFTPGLTVIRGTITDDFARSLVRAGVEPEQIKELERLFAADVDLARDSEPGDAFAVVVAEPQYLDGGRSLGSIAAASLKISGEYYGAFAYGELDGRQRYYDADGMSLPHRFLATPLKYEHISSTFDRLRPDPITGKVRPHEAIDYVAARGTPVVVVGDGIIEFAGWYGGYGYLVKIDHGDGYASAYGHLASFATDISAGKSVKAGNVIGYVGNTGHSTGAHLHFEFALGEEKLDYLSARIHAGDRLTGAQLRGFRSSRDTRLAVMRDGNLQVTQARNLTSY